MKASEMLPWWECFYGVVAFSAGTAAVGILLGRPSSEIADMVVNNASVICLTWWIARSAAQDRLPK